MFVRPTVYLSVRMSVTRRYILPKRGCTYPQRISPSGSPAILVSPYETKLKSITSTRVFKQKLKKHSQSTT